MTDTITLPRAVALGLRDAMLCVVRAADQCGVSPQPILETVAALDAALKEPEPNVADLFAQFAAKQKPLDADMAAILHANIDSLYITDEPAAALAEPDATREPATVPHTHEWFRTGAMEPGVMRCISCGEWGKSAQPEPVHPGYIIGSHWLETAYSRIAAGEAEADVLAEVLGERGWAKREPATEKQIISSWPTELPYVSTYTAFYKGFRAAERFHGIRKEDK